MQQQQQQQLICLLQTHFSGDLSMMLGCSEMVARYCWISTSLTVLVLVQKVQCVIYINTKLSYV